MTKEVKTAALFLGTFVIGVIVGGTFAGRDTPSTQVSSAEGDVTGIGGIFFKVDDPDASRAWYREYLGVAGEGPGVNFFWRQRGDLDQIGFTVWSIFPRDTDYFGTGDQQFMVNYRVRDLDTLLARLEQQGVQQAREIEEYTYGRFAWIVDGDGRLVELWEPVYPTSFEL